MRDTGTWEWMEVVADIMGWGAVALLAAAPMVSGCVSRRAVRVAEPLPVGRYVVAPAPGDTVPPLPEGEERWWLMSAPTGLRLLLPADEAAMLEGGD